MEGWGRRDEGVHGEEKMEQGSGQRLVIEDGDGNVDASGDGEDEGVYDTKEVGHMVGAVGREAGDGAVTKAATRWDGEWRGLLSEPASF